MSSGTPQDASASEAWFTQRKAGYLDAAILDLAWLCQRLGLFMGVFQGLLLCERGGVALDQFGATVANDSRITKIANTIHHDSFDEPINNVQVWADAMRHIQDQARETGTNSEILDFIAGHFERALSAGYGEQDLAALFKIFRTTPD